MKKLFFSIVLVIMFLNLVDVSNAKKETLEIKVDSKTEKISYTSMEELEKILKEKYPDYGYEEFKNPLELVKKQTIIIYDAKNKKSVSTTKKEVGKILEEANIKLSKDDFTIPSLDEILEDDSIFVFRVEYKVEEIQSEIPFTTEENVNKDLKIGEEKIVRAGENGLKKVNQSLKYINGDLVSKKVVKEEILKEAKSKIVEKGLPSLNSLNRSLDMRGIVMTATAYESGPLSTGKRPGMKGYGITATGTRARRGVVAVDPKFIPLGTKLYIKSLDPDIPDYGYAKAEDTGGAIKGARIDLYMDTVYECFQFGRRKVMVFILPADTPDEFFR